MNADSTLEYLDRRPVRLARQTVAVVSLTTFFVYLVYRALYTLNPDAPVFAAVVYLAEIHGFFSLFFYFFQVWAPRGRRCPEPSGRFTVDVFITTYNEDVALLRQTTRAAIAMRLPHRTYLCDDGKRAEVKALADELGCGYITRNDNRHAKAGNWNNAYAQTDGELILTLDADHVVQPALLQRTLGYFEDPKVALVQVPQQYHNLDSVQHHVNWSERRMYGEQDVFFDLVMPGKDHWNSSFFCGTGALLRREALVPHGGILTGSITEDMHTAIVLHSEGWKSVYVNEILVTGLAPTDVSSFLKQRLRWAEGNLKIIFDVNPLTCRGLTIPQRIAYFASMFHWTIGLPKLVYYAAPPWLLISGTFPIAPFNGTVLTLYLANLAAMTTAYKLTNRGRGRLFMDEFFNMLNTFTLLQAFGRFLMQGRKVGVFVVTSKKGDGTSTAAVLPHLLMLAASMLAINWSLMGLGWGITEDRFGVGVAIFWTVYNMVLVTGVVRLALRPAQKRDMSRLRASFVVTRPAAAGGRTGLTADISEGGCRLLWPEPWSGGAQLVELHLPAGPIQVMADVVVQHASTDEWHSYGVRFVNPSQAVIDAIADAIYDVVVPELLHGLREPTLLGRIVRVLRRAWHRRLKSRAERRTVRLPATMRAGGAPWRVTTRDLSTSGASIVSPVLLPVGAVALVRLDLPGGPREQRAEVRRSRAIQTSGRTGEAFELGLRFLSPIDAVADDPAHQAVA